MRRIDVAVAVADRERDSRLEPSALDDVVAQTAFLHDCRRPAGETKGRLAVLGSALDRVRDAIRTRLCGRRTEGAYVHWRICLIRAATDLPIAAQGRLLSLKLAEERARLQRPC
jgi:hypothetical protein